MSMDSEQERMRVLSELRNPTMPNPMLSFETGKLIRDLPPHRPLRERLRSLLRRAPKA